MKSMKPCPGRLLVVVATLAVLASASPRVLLAGESDRQALNVELAALIDDAFESQRAWGSALVARDGRVLFEKGYGWAHYEQAKPNGPRTVFRIQSVSKTFTAMSTLMLVERGLLSLDDRVVDYVPELREGEGVTVRHLLQMESGIPDLVANVLAQGDLDRYHTPEEILQYFVDEPLLFAPGTQFDYSNSNYILLGLIIERVTGKPYARFLRQNIFRPLKMKRSVFDPDDRTFVGRRAVGYDDTTVDPPPVARHYPPSIAYSAGGILSTARDLLKWDQALYGERLLSQESLEAAFTPGVSVYGLGWMLDRVRILGDRHQLVYHPGGGPGFHSLLLRFVDARLTVVLLFNTTEVTELTDEEQYYWYASLARNIGRIVMSEGD